MMFNVQEFNSLTSVTVSKEPSYAICYVCYLLLKIVAQDKYWYNFSQYYSKNLLDPIFRCKVSFDIFCLLLLVFQLAWLDLNTTI